MCAAGCASVARRRQGAGGCVDLKYIGSVDLVHITLLVTRPRPGGLTPKLRLQLTLEMVFAAALALLVTCASAQHGPPGEGNSSHHHHGGDDPFAGSGCNCTSFCVSCAPRSCVSVLVALQVQSLYKYLLYQYLSHGKPPGELLTHRTLFAGQRVLDQRHRQGHHHAVPHDSVRRSRHAEQEHVSCPDCASTYKPLHSSRPAAARPLDPPPRR